MSCVGEKYELILRVYETKKAHIDYLPHDIKVSVNDRDVKTPPMVPASHADVKPRPQAKPIVLSSALRPRTSTMVNVKDTVKIGWYHCDGKKGRPTPEMTYVLVIVREYTHDEATDRIKRLKRPRDVETTKKLLRQKCSTNRDGIQQTAMKMMLKCPVTMMTITCPVKFDSCEHLECFDASNYLKMNAKKPAWSCPICNKRLPFGTLRIDKWFQGIIAQAGERVREIEFDNHGQFKVIDQDEEEDAVADAGPVIEL